MNIILNRLLPIWLLFLALSVSAQQLTPYRNVVPNSYNFWVMTPPSYSQSDSPMPVLLFLHGRSLCSSDMQRCLRYGVVDAVKRGREVNAVVVTPQNPGGSWNPEKLMHLVAWVFSNYNVDTNRFYVLGMSLGGYGTVDFVGTYPEKVAAAMALCGGSTLKSNCGLSQVPLWLLHGNADRAVGIKESRKIVDDLKSCGDDSRVLFTTLEGVDHARPARAFYQHETYDWLFSHSLNDPGRPVNRDYTINTSTLAQAYNDLHSAKTISTIASTSDPSSNPSQPKAKSVATYHTVKSGDTLGAIARRYHTSVSAICRLNGIKSTTTLQIGKKLRVK